ncbi:MAG: adenylate/guanylate cyclase domain-containing protein [Labilibaculum antarcticum]
MTIKDKILEIEEDVLDLINTKFTYSDTDLVPNSEDSNLTFERSVEKKGKKIETCVLYVDIRNSVKLNSKHHTQTMGRIYTALTKSVLKIADNYGGFIRNIIGDRVMVVFPSDNCYTKAVDCAITINHVAKYVINKHFKDVDFKCGIGIDYGELRVVKVGLQKKGSERTENKNLVWIGYPANIASRLTDAANKDIEEDVYIVTRNPINPKAIRPLFGRSSFLSTSSYDPTAPYYLARVETVEMTVEDFAGNISSIKDGELYMMGGKFIRSSKKKKKYSYPEILMTEKVYSGFKKADPERKCIKNKYLKEIPHSLKDVNGKIYGGSITWSFK